MKRGISIIIISLLTIRRREPDLDTSGQSDGTQRTMRSEGHIIHFGQRSYPAKLADSSAMGDLREKGQVG